MSVFLTCLLIAAARVMDITLDTIRTVAIVQGRRAFAACLGFFEALIYIVAVAKVLANFSNYWYAVAYAAGFAAGTFLGITLEQVLAFGEQQVAIFTRRGVQVLATLRAEGFRVTEFVGRGRDGEVQALFVEAPRRLSKRLTQMARQMDPECFYIVNDVRTASAAGQAHGGASLKLPVVGGDEEARGTRLAS